MAASGPRHVWPLVSVILPVYNAAATLARALEGALDGALRDIEVIAVDDGSTDGSADLLDATAALDPRLHVLHGPHRGLVSTLNAAIEAARAPFLARLDADDASHPDRLLRQLETLETAPELDLLGCGATLATPDGRPAGPGMARFAAWVNGLLDPEAIRRSRFVETPLIHGTVMARRAVFAGGYRSGPFPEDYELWLRRLHEGACFAKLAEPLYTWTVRPDSLTHSHPTCSAESFRQLKLDYLMKGPLGGHPAVVVWGTGRNGKRWIRALLARGLAVPAAVDLSPRKIGRTIHGARVVAPDALHSLAPDLPILTAVGKPGGRESIAAWLTASGYVEGLDFWPVC